MGELWEAPAVNWAIIFAVVLVASVVAWILIYSWLDRRADNYVEKWVRDFGVSETTGEFMIVRSHKQKGGRQWLSGFWNTILRHRVKARAQGSRHSSSGSRAATSSALRGRVIPPTRSIPDSSARNK